jgi:hypothetical protein
MEAATAAGAATAHPPATIELPKVRPGAGIAALMGAALGMMTLSIVNFATEANAGFLDWVFSVGKSWVPDGTAIGPYSGLETFMLLGWFGSWFGLHFALRNRTELSTRLWATFALVLMIIAVLLLWPPIIDGLLGK